MIADGLNKIPWDKIKTAARNIGRKLADFLMGFFSEEGLDPKTLGNTLGNAIRTGLEFALGFIENFDFAKV